MMRCVSDRCHQGRDECPTPAICDAQDTGMADLDVKAMDNILTALALVVACALLVLVVFGVSSACQYLWSFL